jgi:predicted Zn-dependent protease
VISRVNRSDLVRNRRAQRAHGISALFFVLASASAGVAFSLVSVEQEVQIGREAQRQVRAKVPELQDAAINRYVDRIGSRLAANAPGPRYPYSFSIANYREVNAFALPGGPIWVHRGALEAAGNEAQLAGVLAHEIAHVGERHAAAQLTKVTIANGLLGLLGAVLDDGKREAAARIGASVAAQSLFMKFSRDDEREADRVGLQIMERAGWDPHGLVEFLETLRNRQKRSPSSVETFLSTHPSPAGRVEELRSLVSQKNGRRDSAEFQEMRRRLQALPPARPMPRESN